MFHQLRRWDIESVSLILSTRRHLRHLAAPDHDLWPCGSRPVRHTRGPNSGALGHAPRWRPNEVTDIRNLIVAALTTPGGSELVKAQLEHYEVVQSTSNDPELDRPEERHSIAGPIGPMIL